MAEVVLRAEIKESELGVLMPVDIQINSSIVELLYLVSLTQQNGPLLETAYLFDNIDYKAEIKHVSYNSPFEILA